MANYNPPFYTVSFNILDLDLVFKGTDRLNFYSFNTVYLRDVKLCTHAFGTLKEGEVTLSKISV